jgi:hypothetical protein
VREFLPNLRREGGGKTSDYLPHPTTLTNVRRRFNTVLSRLLKNDCRSSLPCSFCVVARPLIRSTVRSPALTDMTTRSELYFEVFDWLFVCAPRGRITQCG